ncbi:dihydroorotate dehydrogenase [Ligilactobacillus equi]|uniref:dihydroorotate dehydrogenase n=1 Tax=Ligilactobacillus equi TaxID=137357 RepID=UPI002ED32B1F
MTALNVKLPGLELKNPVMPASGTFGFGDDTSSKMYSLDRLGAVVVKTTTLEERLGNPNPKIGLVRDGAMNAVGLQNPGVEAVIAKKLPALRAKYPHLPIVGSVGGSSVEDYVTVAQKLSNSGLVNALELNISCPNVHEGGMEFGTVPEVAQKVTAAVKAVSKVPVYVKLSPNVTDIVAIAKAVAAGGADGLTMINTILGMHIDVESGKPNLGNIMGGYSGAAVKPVAIRMIYQVSQVVDLPIIGVGGIESVDNIIEMFLAGASAVQIGSAHFKDPMICPHLIDQLPARLKELGYDSIADLQAKAKARRPFQRGDY